MKKIVKKSSENKIVFAFLIMIFISGFYLFIIEKINHSYSYDKHWSIMYFQNPNSEGLDFVIENYEGEDVEYLYKVISIGNEVKLQDAITIKKNEKKEIDIDRTLEEGRIEVIYTVLGEVEEGGKKVLKEIEKNQFLKK